METHFGPPFGSTCGTCVEGASCHYSMEFYETDDFAELKLLSAMLINSLENFCSFEFISFSW